MKRKLPTHIDPAFNYEERKWEVRLTDEDGCCYGSPFRTPDAKLMIMKVVEWSQKYNINVDLDTLAAM